MSKPSTKKDLFERISSEAAACRVCPDLCDRKAVLSNLNGSIDAKILFIGEAPGRQGADRTRVPFSGDQSGRNFDRFLASINLSRDDIFITSAVLCSPRSLSDANRTPKKSEIDNCNSFLQRIIQLIEPRVVVTLGSIALAALKRIEYHELSLKEAVGNVYRWNGRLLAPLYHPSPQVLASHRREEQQLSDYKIVREALSLMDEKITLCWLPHCSTCQKADAYLKQTGKSVTEYRDIKANPLSRTEVERLAKLVGGANELFSRRARLYRSMGLADRELQDDEMLDLMATEYTFIKRPVLDLGNNAVSGFTDKSYDMVLGKE